MASKKAKPSSMPPRNGEQPQPLPPERRRVAFLRRWGEVGGGAAGGGGAVRRGAGGGACFGDWDGTGCVVAQGSFGV